jgi:phosphatidylethanolamine-binding protein (PEBP) family uncharacterized protein
VGRNGFGEVSYGGPCPPTGHGMHHYYFRLYAMDREIRVPDGADIGDVRIAIAEATLGMAELMGTYQR